MLRLHGHTGRLSTLLLCLAPAAQGQKTGHDPGPLASPVPRAFFQAHPSTGDAPLTVRFVDRSLGEVTSWTWDFGDGQTARQRNPTHVYVEGGVYPVSLTVTGPAGKNTEHKPLGVIVRSCVPDTARENRGFPLERGEEFIPITGDDGMGFYCVYSGKAADTGPGISNNVGIFLFPLVNGEILLYGAGYGDANSFVDPTESAAHDVRRVDALVRFCLGRRPQETPVRFVTPHGHIDHINADFIRELRARGYPIDDIYYHSGDANQVRGLPGWTNADRAVFRTLRGTTGECQEELLSLASPLGRIWFHLREGHTSGSIDLVIDVRNDARNRFVVRGSGGDFGSCSIPNVREAVEPHGNVLLTAQRPKVLALSPSTAAALGGTVVVVAGDGFTAKLAGPPDVLFDGVPASAVDVLDDHTLTCAVPPGVPGSTVKVQVLNRNGLSELTGAFAYRAVPTLTSLAPARGIVTGGTRVTLRGSGFLADEPGPNAVTFGAAAATNVQVLDDATLQCTVPPGAPGAVTVAVVNANGRAALAAGFRYDPVIDVLGVTPDSGSARGGTRVELRGAAFAVGASVPEVQFGGVRATLVVRLGDTRIECTTPPGPGGAQVDVRVAGENGADVLAGGFRYFGEPKITALDPPGGPELGGALVTITGSQFKSNAAGPNTVTFGGVPATGVVTLSDTSIRCTTPPGARGMRVDVQVSNANGTARLVQGYRYNLPPAVGSLAPALGPRAGGTFVTLHGASFLEAGAGATEVRFAGIPAASVVVIDDGTLACRTPAVAIDQTADVEVRNANGSAVLPQAFRFVSLPVLTSLEPRTGPARAGTLVTLRGSGFRAGGAGTTRVAFEGLPAENVRVVDDATVTCRAPLGHPGTRADVQLSNDNGHTRLLDAFHYVDAPRLLGVVPGEGPTSGGTSVLLTGTGFRSGGLPLVTFAGAAATDVVVLDDGRLRCTTPSGAHGAAAVTLRNANGTSLLAEGFVYGSPRPVIAHLLPDHGPSSGGGTVVLAGSGFTASQAGTSLVTFGGVPATHVNAPNDETLTCVPPSGTPGARVDVRVRNDNGETTLVAGYRYHNRPTLAAIAPNDGSPLGGELVTLRGSGFTSDQAAAHVVRFGGALAAEIQVLDDATLTCRVPPGNPGARVDVLLGTTNGDARLAAGFRYHVAPLLSQVVPAAGSPLGGTLVTLAGSGLADDGAGAPSVTFAGLAATQVTIVSETTLTCVAPPGAAGATVDVHIANQNGADVLEAAFRYHPAPAIAALAPGSGPAKGGTLIILTGSGFRTDVIGANAITFGGRPARSVVTVDDGRVRAVAPAGIPGTTVDVVLSNSNGSVAVAQGFRYHALPSLASFDPGGSSAHGGALVTLHGSGLLQDGAGTNGVLFGASPGLSVTVVDDRTLRCIAPSGAAGSAVVLTLSNANGTATAPGPFRYFPVPGIAEVLPPHGFSGGGTAVEIRGSGFAADVAGATTVTFGARAAGDVVVVDDGRIHCVAPSGTAGPVDVRVENANGTALRAGGFFYDWAPALTGFSPARGSAVGGYEVTLSGGGFTAAGAGALVVRFGTNPATNVRVLDGGTLVCTAPSGPAGMLADVVVSNARGAASKSGFRYHDLPAVTAVEPAAASALGGATLTLRGSGFVRDDAGPNAVLFGASAALSVAVLDDGTLTCVVPPGAAGATLDVRLTNANGAITLAGGFRYFPGPNLADVQPPHGFSGGGTTVEIHGSSFATDVTGTTRVLFGLQPASDVTVVDDGRIRCVTPPGAAGAVTVRIENSNGAALSPAAFFYDWAPALTYMQPAHGSSLGGAAVVLSGGGFDAAGAGPLTVRFGASTASSVTVQDGRTLVCAAPPGPPGTVVDVVVANARGSASLPGFRYHALPVITALEPGGSNAAGGVVVTLRGSGFLADDAGTNAVLFGTGPGLAVAVLDDATLTCVAPAGTAGTDVLVSLSNGNGSATAASRFRYFAAPTIAVVEPPQGFSGGGTTVAVLGSGFAAEGAGMPAVLFGPQPATAVTVVDDGRIECVTPAGPVGPVGVRVTNANGSALRADGFFYDWAPTVTGVQPGQASSLGGAQVTISGGGFNTGGAPGVLFGSTPATNVRVLDPRTLTCIVPAGPAGAAVDVVVSNARGSSRLAGFRYHSRPALTSIEPPQGPPEGGAQVLLRGSGFAANTPGFPQVRFAGVNATGITVVNDTTVRCTAPAGPARAFATVVLTNQNGTATLVDGYRWLSRDPGDLDGDGIRDAVLSGADAVYVLFGGADLADGSTSTADVVARPIANNTDFGTQVTSGDLNGDLLADLVVAAALDDGGGTDTGAVYVFFGPLAAGPALTADQAGAVFHGAAAGDRFGASLVVRDVTGDRVADLLVGAPRNDAPGTDGGALYLYRGGAAFSGQATNQASRFLAGSSFDLLGTALAAGDVTGDGTADIVVGAPGWGSSGAEPGAVYVFRGSPSLANTTVATALFRLEGDSPDDELGACVAAADADGDGVEDLFLGAPEARSGGVGGGAVYFLRGGPTLGSRVVDVSSVELGAESTGDRLGQALALGDVDGDGRADLLAGAPLHDVPGASTGRAYLVLGGTLQDGAIATLAETILMSEGAPGDQFGSGVAIADLDDDGAGEMLVGAPLENGAGLDSGRVYVFLGSALQATRSAGADDVTFAGTSAGEMLGRDVGSPR